MAVYLYAFALGLPRRLGVRGIDGEPVRLVAAGEVIAVTGELARPPGPNEDALRAQDQVVRALHEKAEALLPARFGTTRATKDGLLADLWRHRERLERALREVAGMDQMTLRIFSDETPAVVAGNVPSVASSPTGAEPGSRPPSAKRHGKPRRDRASGSAAAASFDAGISDFAHTVQAEVAAAAAALGGPASSPSSELGALASPRERSPSAAQLGAAGSESTRTAAAGAGTEYLERVRVRASSAPGLEQIHAAVGTLTHAERILPASTPPLRATVYHLVPRGASERYLAAVESAALPPGVRLAASGPFPAYAFAPELSS